jgi:hypothetical protein
MKHMLRKFSKIRNLAKFRIAIFPFKAYSRKNLSINDININLIFFFKTDKVLKIDLSDISQQHFGVQFRKIVQ